MNGYTQKQLEYINSVDGNAHMIAVEIIGDLEARHSALLEAVAWEREFDEVLVWLVRTGRYPRDMAGKYDLANERECARAEVDRLLEEESNV